MKLSFNFRRIVTASFAVSTVLALGACSDAKEDDEKLTVEGEEAEAQGSAANESAAAVESAPAPTPEPAKAESTPAATTNATVDKSRVVRFVAADQATIASEPKDGSAVVGKLVKGDKVLVVEQNGWGKLAEGMYVNLKHLSHKGVPAERQPAQWTAPAH